ncbi:MAG: hypothetical protein SCK70_07960, partial [bacterium]|nr:hypothetical protein [bacterium]
ENFSAMTALANAIFDQVDPSSPSPLFDLLPKENRVKGSELLFRGQFALEPVFTFGDGDVLQLGGKIFGVLADYQSQNDHCTTKIIIPYPSQQIASTAFHNLVDNLDPYLTILEHSDDWLVFKDYQNFYGTVKQDQNMLFIHIHLPVLPK